MYKKYNALISWRNWTIYDGIFHYLPLFLACKLARVCIRVSRYSDKDFRSRSREHSPSTCILSCQAAVSALTPNQRMGLYKLEFIWSVTRVQSVSSLLCQFYRHDIKGYSLCYAILIYLYGLRFNEENRLMAATRRALF